MYYEPSAGVPCGVGDVELDIDPPRRTTRRKPPMPAFVKIYGRQICPRRRMKVIAPRPTHSQRWEPARANAMLDSSPQSLETAVGREADGRKMAGPKADIREKIEECGDERRSCGRKERHEHRHMAELATRLEALKVQACADECRQWKARHNQDSQPRSCSRSASDEVLASYDKGGLIRPDIGRYLVPPEETPAPTVEQAANTEEEAQSDSSACCEAAARVQRLEASNAELRAAICRLNQVCNAKGDNSIRGQQVQTMELEVSKARNVATVERDYFRRRLAERTRQHELRVDAVRREGEERLRALKTKMAAEKRIEDIAVKTPWSG